MRGKRDKYLYDEPETTDPNYADDEDADYNALIDEFDTENVDLAYHYLRRYKLFKLRRTLIDLEWDDIAVFLILEEEMGNAQAAQQLRMEQQSRNNSGNQ